MLSPVMDSRSQPVHNLVSWGKLDARWTGTVTSYLGSMGTGYATTTDAFDTVDVPFTGARARTYTLTSIGSWGRRWRCPTNLSSPIIPTKGTIYFSFWIKMNAAMTITPYIEFGNPDGTYGGGGAATTVPVLANTWTLIQTQRAYNVTGVAYLHLISVGFTSPSNTDSGFAFAITGGAATLNTPYTAGFFDGDTPGWVWDGPAGYSTSYGYPHTLANAAAEVPMADLVGNNVQAQLSAGALSAFTLYQVYDIFSVAVTYMGTWKLASTPIGQVPDWSVVGAMQFQRRGTFDGTYSHARFGTSVNSNQTGIYTGSSSSSVRGHTVGRHIVAVSAPTGLTTLKWMLDGLADASPTPSISPGNGFSRAYLRVYATTTDNDTVDSSSVMLPIRTIYFGSEHTRATRVAVQKYLSELYGVIIP